MKILINPSYQENTEFCHFVHDIAEQFAQGELVQQGRRNTLRRFSVGGVNVVVKRFGKPNFLNRIVYSFVRKPKGVRAYEYAFRVRSAGFDTPEPLAYVEKRVAGLISDSYFVSAECPYTRRFYEFGDAEISGCRDIISAFAAWAAAFHEAGMLHRDFSPGNILFENSGDGWKFSVVDINRMSFAPVSVEQGCRNFARLWGQPGFFHFLAGEYARARHADSAECLRIILSARKKFWTRFAKRHKVKYRLEL